MWKGNGIEHETVWHWGWNKLNIMKFINRLLLLRNSPDYDGMRFDTLIQDEIE